MNAFSHTHTHARALLQCSYRSALTSDFRLPQTPPPPIHVRLPHRGQCLDAAVYDVVLVDRTSGSPLTFKHRSWFTPHVSTVSGKARPFIYRRSAEKQKHGPLLLLVYIISVSKRDQTDFHMAFNMTLSMSRGSLFTTARCRAWCLYIIRSS